MATDRRTTIGQRGVLVIPRAIRDHATFVEGQEVRVIEVTPRTLLLTVEADPAPIVAAVIASTTTTQSFPKIAARLAAGRLERPAGRRDQGVDFDDLAIDGATAARRGTVSSPARPDTGRRALDLPNGEAGGR
jgi:bifunctional DNA-binding transcriptional regulator/antitoxin component of YhaV-PrlF toxin-antitoxin module